MKYQFGQRADQRRIKPEVWLTGFIALVLVGVLGYVFYDLNKNPDTIDDSANQAILGEFQGTQAKFVRVEGETYSIEIPEDWTQVNSPEQIIARKRFYPDRYTGVEREDVGKWLDIYYQELPEIVLDRAVPIEVLGNTVVPGPVSPRCKDFTESVGNLDGVESVTTWEELTFTCTMNTVTNVVGAFKNTPERGVFVEGANTEGRYLFVYGDHSSRIDNSTFVRMLRSFEAK